MMHVLTKEEYELSQAQNVSDAEVWWIQLSQDEKIKIHKIIREPIEQMNCSHEWEDQKFYDSTITVCTHCNLPKPKTN